MFDPELEDFGRPNADDPIEQRVCPCGRTFSITLGERAFAETCVPPLPLPDRCRACRPTRKDQLRTRVSPSHRPRRSEPHLPPGL